MLIKKEILTKEAKHPTPVLLVFIGEIETEIIFLVLFAAFRII